MLYRNIFPHDYTVTPSFSGMFGISEKDCQEFKGIQKHLNYFKIWLLQKISYFIFAIQH